MSALRLVIFDVDGTLVDSEADILAAMTMAYAAHGLPEPERGAVRSIVGLSLPEAFARLLPDHADRHATLVEAYKDAYVELRIRNGAEKGSPLFPGARDLLDRLRAEPYTLLAVATGKSRRGLDKLIEGHGLQGYFQSEQVSDHHPSKPHPSMIEACLAETGVDRARAVMIGDTSFDIDMARAARVRSVAVSWGYHPIASLNADHIARDFGHLTEVLDSLWEAVE